MFIERRGAVKNVLAARNPKPAADTAAAATETVINNQSGVLSARRFWFFAGVQCIQTYTICAKGF
jgi:hypothetical protein